MTNLKISPKTLPSRLLLGGAAAFLIALAAGTASAQTDHAAAERACSIDMKLSSDSPDYQDCLDTLTRIQATLQDQATVQSARAACIGSGLVPGSRDFALCTLDTMTARPGRVEIEGR